MQGIVRVPHTKVSACIMGSLFLAYSAANAHAGAARLLARPDLGITLIQFDGKIERGDLQRIRDLVSKAEEASGKNRVFVSLDSPGGLVAEGVSIGLYLRQQGIGTIILPNDTCASACSFIFWGGFDRNAQKTRRIILSGGRLGVHQMSADPKHPMSDAKMSANEIFEHVQRGVASMMKYMDLMGVTTEVQRRNFLTGTKDIYFLSRRELIENHATLIDKFEGTWKVSERSETAVQLPPKIIALQARVSSPPAPSSRVTTSPLPTQGSPTGTSTKIEKPNHAEAYGEFIKGPSGLTKNISMDWSSQSNCIWGKSKESVNEVAILKTVICLGRRVSVNINYRDGTFADYTDWVPTFSSDNEIVLRGRSQRGHHIKLSNGSYSQSGAVFSFNEAGQIPSSSYDNIWIRLGPVELQFLPPNEVMRAAWPDVIVGAPKSTGL